MPLTDTNITPGQHNKYVWTNDVDVDEQLSNRDYSSAIEEWKRSSDFIHREFENRTDGYSANENNSDKWELRDHDNWDAEERKGFCSRNETEVRRQGDAISGHDWSSK